MINIEHFKDKILEIAEKCPVESRYWFGDDIPIDKIKNAKRNIGIPPEENVLILIDSTILGGCERGLVVCSHGIYWKNNWGVETLKNKLNWEEFKKAKIDVLPNNKLQLGRRNVFSCLQMSSEDTYNLMKNIQNFLLSIEDTVEKNTAPQQKKGIPNFDITEWNKISIEQIFADFQKNEIRAKKKYTEGNPIGIIIKGKIEEISEIDNGRSEGWYAVRVDVDSVGKYIYCLLPEEAEEVILKLSTGDIWVFIGYFHFGTDDDTYELCDEFCVEVKYYFDEEGFEILLNKGLDAFNAETNASEDTESVSLDSSKDSNDAIGEIKENEKGYVGMVKSLIEKNLIEEQRELLKTLRTSSDISEERSKELEIIIKKELGLIVEIADNEKGFVGIARQFIENGSLEDNVPLLVTLAQSSGISEERKKILLEHLLSKK